MHPDASCRVSFASSSSTISPCFVRQTRSKTNHSIHDAIYITFAHQPVTCLSLSCVSQGAGLTVLATIQDVEFVRSLHRLRTKADTTILCHEDASVLAPQSKGFREVPAITDAKGHSIRLITRGQWQRQVEALSDRRCAKGDAVIFQVISIMV